MKPHHILTALIVLALLAFVYGCASEGVSKGVATQAVALSAGTTWVTSLTGIATGGWSILVGVAAGIVRLFFAASTSTDAPGAGHTVIQAGCPWWVVIVAILWLKKNRVWQVITAGPDGRRNALKRLFGVKVKDPAPNPPKLQPMASTPLNPNP